MTILRIPRVIDSADNIIPATVGVRLVDAGNSARIGWLAATGQPITEYQRMVLDAETDDLLLPLSPQPLIAIDAAASPTWYRVEISVRHRTESAMVQVPDSVEVVDLMTLLGVATMDGESLLYGRLLSGDEKAAMDAANAPSAGNPLATMDDVESGVAGVASFNGRTGAVMPEAGDYAAFSIQGYQHTQASPAAEWVIAHNLGHKPVVELFSAGGLTFIAGVIHESANLCRVHLSTAQAGEARCV